MKLFDTNKWEEAGKAELEGYRSKHRERFESKGEPHTWILVVTAVTLFASAVFLGLNGLLQAKGIGDFGTVEMFAIGAALLALIGIAYAVSIAAGRTAATSKGMTLAENAITMVCSVLIALVSAWAFIVRLTM